MKTLAIIGMGAIGGYCAVKLMQDGFGTKSIPI